MEPNGRRGLEERLGRRNTSGVRRARAIDDIGQRREDAGQSETLRVSQDWSNDLKPSPETSQIAQATIAEREQHPQKRPVIQRPGLQAHVAIPEPDSHPQHGATGLGRSAGARLVAVSTLRSLDRSTKRHDPECRPFRIRRRLRNPLIGSLQEQRLCVPLSHRIEGPLLLRDRRGRRVGSRRHRTLATAAEEGRGPNQRQHGNPQGAAGGLDASGYSVEWRHVDGPRLSVGRPGEALRPPAELQHRIYPMVESPSNWQRAEQWPPRPHPRTRSVLRYGLNARPNR
jgi:hypothetical protein